VTAAVQSERRGGQQYQEADVRQRVRDELGRRATEGIGDLQRFNMMLVSYLKFIEANRSAVCLPAL